jgi:hypothetical protein
MNAGLFVLLGRSAGMSHFVAIKTATLPLKK